MKLTRRGFGKMLGGGLASALVAKVATAVPAPAPAVAANRFNRSAPTPLGGSFDRAVQRRAHPLSALEVAQAEGFVGDETAFLNQLKRGF